MSGKTQYPGCLLSVLQAHPSNLPGMETSIQKHGKLFKKITVSVEKKAQLKSQGDMKKDNKEDKATATDFHVTGATIQ